jgi:hypothetical protein
MGIRQSTQRCEEAKKTDLTFARKLSFDRHYRRQSLNSLDRSLVAEDPEFPAKGNACKRSSFASMPAAADLFNMYSRCESGTVDERLANRMNLDAAGIT